MLSPLCLLLLAQEPSGTAAPAAKTDGEKVVAILDLKVEGDVVPLANALATILASDVEARPGLKAVSRNELKSLLANSADAQLLGCVSQNCAADVAKLVDAQLVITGTLGAIVGGEAGPGGRALVLTLSLLDPAGPSILQRVDVTWRGDPEELVTAIPPTLDRLMDGSAAASYTGALEIFAPPGTTVALDGKELGTAPLAGALRDLPIGVHTVDVSGAGFVPAKKDVVVAHNQTTSARLVLEPEPYYTQWWFWTAIGGGAVVAIGAGTAIALATLAPPATRIIVKAPFPENLAVTP